MENKLQSALWDWFCTAQCLLLQGDDLALFIDFVAGKTKEVPFTKGSKAHNTCVLCGKL